MEFRMARPDPSDAEAVWRVGPGDRVTIHVRNILVGLYLLVPVGLSATLGSITLSSPDGSAITSFWPAAAFQVVFPIWFGIFGAVPCVVGPMLGNSLVGASPFAFVASNTVQSCLAGWWFRRRRLDPRLRERRDWIGLAVVGCLLATALGAAVGVGETYLRAGPDEVADLEHYLGQFLRWFWGNSLPCWLLAPLLLKAASPLVVRGPFFCQRFWGAVDRGPEEHMRPGAWVDLPMAAKLMVLVLLVGLLPLYAVGGLTVYGTLTRAESLAAYVNQRLAYDARNEIERHLELLSAWASEYDRPDFDEEMRRKKLAEWGSRKDAFTSLEVTDSALIEPMMLEPVLQVYQRNRDQRVFLFVVEVGGKTRLRGIARLASFPDQVLTGLVAWRQDPSPIGRSPIRHLVATEGYLLLDPEDHVLYRRGPKELTGLSPPDEPFEGRPRIVEHGGQAWHIAEARTARPGLRIITITSARAGQAAVLSNMPNALAVLINLAIFLCLIVGTAMAHQLGGRVLEIAEHVREAGGTPGDLAVPVRGRDELGYLAGTLNRMSGELAEYVRELQATTAEKERLAREMELAREVQQSVLPKCPPGVSGYDLAGLCLPTFEVGGDFFDMFLTRDGRTTLMIGDAVGKGLRAAMLTMETHGVARAAALDGLAPDRVLAVTNHAIISRKQTVGDFVTMFCAQLDPNGHCLHYANAGHNPPILVRDGQPSPLEVGGLPLAVREEGGYELRRADLGPGDCLVMYTDGVTEATNPTRDMFLSERLDAVIKAHASASARHLTEAIVDEVRRFTSAAPQSDDLTLLVIRRQAADC